MALSEKAIENYLVKRSKEYNFLCLKFNSSSASGVCDRLVVSVSGITYYVELKSPKGRLSKLQEKFIKDMAARNVIVYIISSKDRVDRFLQQIEWRDINASKKEKNHLHL